MEETSYSAVRVEDNLKIRRGVDGLRWWGRLIGHGEVGEALFDSRL